MTTLAWTVVVVVGYLAIVLPFAFFLGRAVRRNTGDPPEPEDWWRAEDMPNWDFPERKEVA